MKLELKTEKVNSTSELHIDNTSDCFKTLKLTQYFEGEKEPIVVAFEMDVLNKQLEINELGLSKTEIDIFIEFINQLKHK